MFRTVIASPSPPHSATADMTKLLPPELSHHILGFLTITDVIQCRAVSKPFKQLAEDE